MLEGNYILNDEISFDFRQLAETHATTQRYKKYKIKSKYTTYEYFITDTGYKYKIYSTGESSNKYGVCEVCKKHCSEVFSITEERKYKFEHNQEIYEGYTFADCQNYFGHKDCLLSKVR